MSNDNGGTGTDTGAGTGSNTGANTGGSNTDSNAAAAGHASTNSNDGDGGTGYPANTPVVEMTAPQQAAYWKAQSRKHESRVKALGTPEEIKAWREASSELEKLRRASMGETERAVAEAREHAAAEAGKAWAVRLVAAEFRAATAGRVEPSDLSGVLDTLDLSKFLDDDGSVNIEKVTQLASRITGSANTGGSTAFPFIGQGTRHTSRASGLAAGQAAFEARKGRIGGMPSF